MDAEVSEANPVNCICANCKFFNLLLETHGECLKNYVTFSEFNVNPDLESQFVIVDAEGALYNFKYFVSKDFGCVNFISK